MSVTSVVKDPAALTMTIRVTLSKREGGGTTMAIATTFPSTEAMEQLISMGMEEGMASAIGQIDGLLSAEDAYL